MRGVNKAIILYKDGSSIPQVSEITGIPMSTIRYHLKKAGVLRDRITGIRMAGKDGRISRFSKGCSREFTPEWCANISKGKSGRGKGLSLKPNGYIEITMGEHKGRTQHRVVIEKHLGRPLMEGECVHHLNHNKSDNRVQNLAVMSISDHQSLHAKKRSSDRARNERGQFI